MLYRAGWVEQLPREGAVGAAVDWLRTNQLLPEGYLYGFSFAYQMARVRTAFLDGAFSDTGWPTFFPYCVLYKTPLWLFGLLGTACLAAVCACSRNRHEQARQLAAAWDRTAPLWIFLAVYWLVAINSTLNIGQRHLLPTQPIVFILAGAAGFAFRTQLALTWRLLRVAAVVLLCGFVAESLYGWPHYLCYFNSIAGGSRNGYRHLVDSSLDWGQDLRNLRDWLTTNRLDIPVYLSYFGTAAPAYYGIQAELLPSYPPVRPRGAPQALQPGLYCISATMLQGVHRQLRGPWNEAMESDYRALAQMVEHYGKHRDDQERLEEMLRQSAIRSWSDVFFLFEEARFARLCAFFLKGEPDYQIGYSINIYVVREADLERGLFGDF
jgi:hypothetical protein